MPFDGKLPHVSARFGWILQGERHGPHDAFDEDLGNYAEAAVIPTRGALVPEWLLVVPRKPCLSAAELDRSGRARLLAIATDVSGQVSSRVGGSVTFEHGPGRRETVMGCGVDQAHLHVVGGAPDLLDRLVEHVGSEWSTVDHADPWVGVPPGSDYLMIRDHRQAVLAFVSNPTSQCLRRALADVLGRGHEWNYRYHPNVSTARRTKEIFRGAFADTAA